MQKFQEKRIATDLYNLEKLNTTITSTNEYLDSRVVVSLFK